MEKPSTTLHPGIGSDQKTNELQNLVGQITSTWAGVEDQLFQVFVVALAGTWLVGDVRPYRAVFFTFSSYEGKMRMTHNAMKSRFGENKQTMEQWKVLRTALDGFSGLRNEIAHLIPMAKPITDPNAEANVRLIPAFWKNTLQVKDFSSTGYSVDELWQALKPYWGYHPRIGPPPPGEEGYQLSYRLQQFANALSPLRPSPPGAQKG